MSDAPLAPRLRDRLAGVLPGPGWRRVALLRRTAAAALAVLALVLALAPPSGAAGVPLVVAATDLPSGRTLRATDLTVRTWPADLVPAGVVQEVGAAEGRVLVGDARAGAPLTDVRLAGAAPAAAMGDDPGASAVPVRLTDAGVANLLVPGSLVDVVTVGGEVGEPLVLAADAQVVTVLPDREAPGRLVLVAMPRKVAARVAAASLADQVAVTLR